MEETSNICRTCLSTDRCLVPVHKLTILLQEINFEELEETLGGICWECCSIIVKFYKFKHRAKKAHKILSHTSEHINAKPLTTLTTITKVLYDYQFVYCFDPLTDCDTKLKVEPDFIKQEATDHSNDNLDNIPHLDENKTNFDEETGSVYSEMIETKRDSNLFRGNEIIKQGNGVLDSTSDNDENIFEETENVYTDIIETKQNERKKEINNQSAVLDNTSNKDESIFEITEKVYADSFKIKNKQNKTLRTQKYLQCTNGVKNIFEKTNENIGQKLNADNVKTEQRLKHKERRERKIEIERDVKEKFVTVVLNEEEMLRVREEKRSHFNYKKIPFKCDSCVLGFTRKDTYSLHIKKKHDEAVGAEICDVCYTRFRHKLALNNHRRKHYIVYRCRLCKYESHEIMWAAKHCATKHVVDKPESIHCAHCDVVFKTPDDLEAHIQTEHSLFCVCGIKFKDKNNLRRHISRAHSGSRHFICDICKQTFKTKTRLETHMVTHSSNIAKRLAYCQQCNVQYKNIQVYRNHLKTSAKHSEGQHPCSECNKKFRSKGYLRQHYNFYHLRKSKFKCEVCNKIFISKWRLHSHNQLHHGLSRPRNHSCNTCAKKFFTMATLRTHQLTHSEQRSFMCEDCGDTFKQSAALYTHTRLVHKGGGARKKRDI